MLPFRSAVTSPDIARPRARLRTTLVVLLFVVGAIPLALLGAACSSTSDEAETATDTPTTISLTPTSVGDDESTADESTPTTTTAEAPPATVPDQGELEPNAVVERVVDGDTIELVHFVGGG